MADLQPLLPRKIPQSVFPPIAPDLGSVPAMTTPASAALGTIAPPALANITDNPRMVANSSDPLINRTSALEADIYKRENPIKPTTTLGKIGHVAANVGNVLGDIFAPGVMSAIPGTQLGNERIEGLDQSKIADISKQQTEEAQRGQTAANTAYLNARPAIEQAKILQKLTTSLAPKGIIATMNPDGTIDTQDDPTSQGYKDRVATTTLREAQAQHAQILSQMGQPGSPLYEQKQHELAQVDQRIQASLAALGIRRETAAADITRADAYALTANQRAYNRGLDGQVLPGAPQITDDEGHVTTVGSTNASSAIKSNANVGQFGDVAGATDNIEQTAKALVDSGGRLNSPGVVYALQNTHGTPSQILQSVDKANLTPEEREYVISNIAYRENLQALRKSAGGTVSDSAVDRLEQLAPSGSTPDLSYLLGQTGQIRQTWSRLGKGVATAKGGLKIPDEHPSGSSENEPPRPANVPKGYHFNAKGSQGAGWYK